KLYLPVPTHESGAALVEMQDGLVRTAAFLDLLSLVKMRAAVRGERLIKAERDLDWPTDGHGLSVLGRWLKRPLFDCAGCCGLKPVWGTFDDCCRPGVP